jgi:formate hydrogenlyase transcriptional activator
VADQETSQGNIAGPDTSGSGWITILVSTRFSYQLMLESGWLMGNITELEDFVQSFSHPAWLTTADGLCICANPALARLTGFDSGHFTKSDWCSFLVDGERIAATSLWRRSLETSTPYRSRVHLQGLDKAGQPVELLAFKDATDDGKDIWLFTALHSDGTIPHNPSLEVQLQATLNIIPAYTWYALPSGALTFVNERIADYLGLPKDHPLRFGIDTGASWDSHIPLLHPDDHQETRRVWSTCLRTGFASQVTFRVRGADGGYRWFLSCAEPFRTSAGAMQYWIGVNLDIDDAKRGEEKIREQEAEVRQMLDLAPQIVAVFGPNRERLYANRFLLDYFGITLDDWRRRRDTNEFFHPDDRERVRADTDRAFSGTSTYEVDFRMRGTDGRYRWFMTRFSPLHDDNGKIIRWYVAATDIDERKKAEERLQQENAALREEVDQASMFEEIVGTSSALQTVLSRISKVAPSNSTVLITGETGTGKELVARAIHRRSDRKSRPFVSVNCAAVPRDLIASELFGHEKGAFTGATQRRLGRFQLADGGTIFLDEVGELSQETQIVLLRVLQEREFERVGGAQPIRVDVRVIAATNRNLQKAVADGSFRQDLFYRLNVFPIEMPALRERKDDILMLVEYFVQRYARRVGKRIRSIDKRALDVLQCYDWPGNIRELQNIIERSVILSSGDLLSVDELWLSKQPVIPESRLGAAPIVKEGGRGQREIIEAALAESRGRISGPSGAAARLRVPPSTLDHWIKALKIDKKNFKFQ